MNVVDWLVDFKINKQITILPPRHDRNLNTRHVRNKLAFYSSLSLMNVVDWLLVDFKINKQITILPPPHDRDQQINRHVRYLHFILPCHL